MEASVAQETVDDGGAAEEVARLEAERIQAEQVEAARLQAEQEEAMRTKAAQEEAERIEAEQAESARLQALEAERIRNCKSITVPRIHIKSGHCCRKYQRYSKKPSQRLVWFTFYVFFCLFSFFVLL